MAENKRFIVKNGLQTNNVEFVSNDKSKEVIASLSDAGTLSFTDEADQLLFSTTATGTDRLQVNGRITANIVNVTDSLVINGSSGTPGQVLKSDGINTIWADAVDSIDSVVGSVGFTGSQGISGPIGFTGSQGISGFTGSIGSTGFTGSQGPNANQSLDTTNNVRFASLGVNTNASGTAGEIRATGDITAFFSDDRLKTRIGNIENAINKINTLDTFYYIPNKTAIELGYIETRHVGISAQQIQSIMPEVVKSAPIDEKYLTVQYEKLIPLLITAIKELDIKIEKLME